MYKNILPMALFTTLSILIRTLEGIEYIAISLMIFLLLKFYFDIVWERLLFYASIGLALGWLSLGLFYSTNGMIAYESTQHYEALVNNYKEATDTAELTIYKVDDKLIFAKKVKLKLGDKELQVGESIQFKGVISNIELPSNPGEVNYRFVYYGKNIIGEVEEITILDRRFNSVGQLNRWIGTFKRSIIQRLSTVLSSDKVGLSLAMSLGDKALLSKEDTIGLRKLGLSHILVVSSLHVGLLVVLLTKQLDRLKLSFHLKEVFVMVFLLILLLLIASKISIVKCLFLYTAHLLAQMYNRKPFYLLSLVIYGLLAILINPFYIFNLSFTLSLMAYLGVFLYYRYTWKSCPKYFRLWYLTLCIYIGILPIMIVNFGGFHYLGLIISPLIMPYLEFVISFNFASVFIESLFNIPFLLDLLDVIMTPVKMLVRISNGLSGHFLSLPYSNSVLICFCLANVFLLFFDNTSIKRRKLLVFLRAGLLMTILLSFMFHYLPMRIFYLDVGMGDSQYIYHRGKSLLIDGGKSYESNHMQDVMKVTGEQIIDVAIISHGHNDHYGGVIKLLEKDLIQSIYLSLPAYNKLKDKYEILEKYNRMNRLVIVEDNQVVKLFDKWLLKIYKPSIISDDPNNNSIVTLLQRGDLEFLFTGDAEKEEEKWITSDILPDIIDEVDYLKIAHHGSNTSSTESFLLAAKPNYGMISVGENNAYGLPDEDVLLRYDTIGTKLHRTDHHGALEIKVFYPWVIHKEY